MKTLTTIFLLLTGHSLFSQQDFEGVITYQLVSKSQQITAMADVYFKKDQIRAALRTNDTGTKSKDDLLVLLDSGIVYHLNLEKKICRQEDLRKSHSLLSESSAFEKMPLQNRTILNFNCNAVKLAKSADNHFMGSADITLWQADSLRFACDKKFASSEMSVAFVNGSSINLAAKFVFSTSKGKDTVTVEAIAVEAKILAPEIFSIPVGLTMKDSVETELINTQIVEVKKGNNPPPSPPLPPKRTTKKIKHK